MHEALAKFVPLSRLLEVPRRRRPDQGRHDTVLKVGSSHADQFAGGTYEFLRTRCPWGTSVVTTINRTPVQLAGAVPSEPVRRRLRDSPLALGVAPYLIAADLVAAIAAAALTRLPLVPSVLLALATLLLLGRGRSYRSRLELSLLDDLPPLVGHSVTAGALVLAVQVLRTGPVEDQRLILVTAALLSVLVVSGRGLAYFVVRTARARGAVQHATLILGAGQSVA